MLEANTPAAILSEVMQVLDAMGKYHPEEPHWYLPLIGVDPMYHGNGVGTALMGFALEQLDTANDVAYLESSNPRNLALYERLGFKRVGQIQIGASPTMVAMVRHPGG